MPEVKYLEYNNFYNQFYFKVYFFTSCLNYYLFNYFYLIPFTKVSSLDHHSQSL